MTVADYTAVMAGLPPAPFTVVVAEGAALAAYRRLRREVFVAEQGLLAAHREADDVDDDPRAVSLVAVDRSGAVLGGVRLAPATEPDLGWWRGSRLAVDRRHRGVGAALVRAACAHAEAAGALRFEATVQDPAWFARLGWQPVGPAVLGGRPHALVRWPVGRLAALAAATKAPLGGLVGGLMPAGWVGDDAAPVPGSDLVAACDAILPAMVDRDPAWAGWCGVLVNVNDLAAMGAEPVGLLDAVAGPSAAAVGAVLSGVRAAAAAYGVPVLGGHTQLGVPAALAVTALGRAADPVPAGGGRPGDTVSVLADLAGRWRPGYSGRQWDSTTARTGAELRELVGAAARTRPAAAKDVSMAGLAGSLGMLAEASGCGAVLDVAAVPRPAAAGLADWLACFPGFALVSADRPGRPAPAAGPGTSAACGTLEAGAGVRLRWPDGVSTVAVPGPVTGLGPA
jgi:putative N-acetyltransferase (TIGR04045 family)